ncbi:hypothetical protein FISHEDRAFT_17992, partial [Fistulina hepatica ATCC 64428]
HHDDIVEHLDVIDAQVGTVSNLTNATNTILIPPFPYYSRKPVVVLPTTPPSAGDKERGSQYEDDLDRHVDDVLRRRDKFRRTMLGVWSFIKTREYILFTIYFYGHVTTSLDMHLLVFLAKIINFHNEALQGFWIEVSSQVVDGLFCVTGFGLFPSRVLDMYRVTRIWYYKRLTRRLRTKLGIPLLIDENDLPDPRYDPNYVRVLTKKQEKDLHRQQVKFHKHQTWYRAHMTETHRVCNILFMICSLIDASFLAGFLDQIILAGTMWGLNRFQRPAWSTGILIPASFLCGIVSGVLIWRGSEKTKKVDVVRERLALALA